LQQVANGAAEGQGRVVNFCARCGRPLPGAWFCTGCGMPVLPPPGSPDEVGGKPDHRPGLSDHGVGFAVPTEGLVSLVVGIVIVFWAQTWLATRQIPVNTGLSEVHIENVLIGGPVATLMTAGWVVYTLLFAGVTCGVIAIAQSISQQTSRGDDSMARLLIHVLTVAALVAVGCGHSSNERGQMSTPSNAGVTVAPSTPAATEAKELRGYLAVTPDGVMFVQWTETDGRLLGYFQGVGVTADRPLEPQSKNGAIMGVRNGASVTLSASWSGSSATWTGTLDGDNLTIAWPA
jgi:hypothetical protein